MKKLIVVLIILSIFLPYSTVYAAVTPITNDPVLSTNPIVAQQLANQFYNVITSDGNPDQNVNGKPLNLGVYKFYGIVVYGNRHGSKDINGEYRHLGYNYNDDEVTNDKYINDANSNTPLENKDWCTVSGASGSWNSVHLEQVDQVFRSTVIYNDGQELDMSISQILAKKASSDAARKTLAYLMVPPTLLSSGTVKLNHKTSSGHSYYDTFTIPPLNFNFNPSCIITSANTFTLQPDQASIDIPVTLSSPLDAALPIGKTAKDIINSVSFMFEGVTKSATPSSPSAAFTKTINSNTLKVGSNSIRITGYANLRSIYNDQYSGLQASKVITVIKPDPSNPVVNLDASVTPDKVKFDDKDIDFTVRADANLIGYNDLSNIANVKIYCRKEEDSTALEQTASAALSTSAAFNLTVPKDKVTLDNFYQNFIVTAVYTYKIKVNGKPNATATKTVSALIYKTPIPPPVIVPVIVPETPPAAAGIPPVADIRTSKIVMAGEPVSFDGTGSYDPDGSIMGYSWSIPGLSDCSGLSGSTAAGWFRDGGSCTVGLTVIDNSNLTGSDQEVVTILPPKPSLILKQLGTSKENRKVTLDLTGSRSPSHYPIRPELTTIAITPVSGGTMGDIKAAGPLTGVMSADVLFKKAGVYNIHATVQNTAGYTDQADITLTIVPDTPPIAGFAVQSMVLRDPDDSNYASLTYIDQSYSSDNDYIAANTYSFTYDKDNNGIYDNEVMTINTNNYNNNVPYELTAPWGDNLVITVRKDPDTPIWMTVKGKNVGKYKAELTAVEGFGQDTLPQFISSADYRSDDTNDVSLVLKKSNVANVAPAADFEIIKKKFYDIVVVTDNAGTNLTNLQTDLDSWKAQMLADNVDIKYCYLTQKAKIGRQSKVVTNYMYARRCWVSYYDTGSNQIIGRNPVQMTWTNQYGISYGYYETVWSNIPNPLPGFTKPLTYSVGTQYYNSSYMYGQSRGTRYLFFDPNNYSGTVTGIELNDYSDGAYWGLQCDSYSNIQTGMDNYWYNIGQSQNNTLYYDVYGMDFSQLNSITFRKNAEKILIVFSNDDSTDYSYTNPNGTGYNFGSLDNTVKNFVTNNNMAVYTVVPDDMLDIKYNSNNYNTNISGQQMSLRELTSASPVRGKLLSAASWKTSLDYIKYRDPVTPLSLTIDNNTLRIKLGSPADYDLLMNYINYLSVISDPEGNQINGLSDVLITNVTGKDQGTPDLYNGLLFEDAIGPANNGKTVAYIGSPSQTGNRYRYLVGTDTPVNTPALGVDVGSWPLITSGGTITCSDGVYIGVAEVDVNNKVVRFSQGKAVAVNEAH